MNIKTKETSYVIIFIILLVGSVISGCSEKREPYYPIEYEIIVETNDKATVYLPILLDLPDNKVADLAKSLKVKKSKSPNVEITYDIIETIHGKALRINTTGNVTLKAVSSNNYYKTHPAIPLHPFIPGNENYAKFFNMSMNVNESSYHWAYLESNNNNNHSPIKVLIISAANTKIGGEYLVSEPDDTDDRQFFFSLEPGWQKIVIRRSTIYY